MDFNSIQDPMVRDYLMKKYGANKVQDAQQGVDNANLIQAGVGIGDMIVNNMQRPVALDNTMQNLGKAPAMVGGEKQKTDVSGLQKQAQMKLEQANSDEDNAVKMAFEQRKAELAQEAAAARQAVEDERWNKTYSGQEAARNEAARHNRAMEGKAAQPKPADPLVEAIRMQTLDRMQRDAKQDADALKVEGYGIANTPDDAKKIKDSIESKANFDNKLQQLIELRTSKGGELMDREAVARGQQLSKDLLLEYKNMQKLGVLSNSDEAIINAIIPSDPLQFNSPLAAVQGQDPILNNMKKFKGDTDSDFQTRVKTRIKADSRPEETKVINGATYRKVQGGWQKVK